MPTTAFGTPLPSPAATARVVRNGLAFGGSKVATSLVLLAWQVALARLLGPRTYGIYAALGAGLALAAVLPDFGLGLVVARDAAKRPEAASRLLAATLLIQPSLAAVAVVGVIGLGWRWTTAQGLGALILLAALPLVTDTLGNLCHAQLVAAERLVAPSAIAVLHAAVLVAVGAPLLWAGLGLWGVYGAILVASLVRAAVYWHRLRVVGLSPAWPVSGGLARALLGQGWPLALLALVGLGRINADKLLATGMLGAAATGQLQAAFVVVFGLGDLLSATLLTAVLPVMARTFQQGRREEFDYVVERVACAGLLVGAPLAFGGVLFARRVCAMLFGAGFGETPRLLMVLLAALAATMVGSAFQQVLIVQGRQGTLLIARSAVLACHLLLLFVLVSRIGLVGTAVASLVTEAVALVVLAALARPPASSLGRLARSGLSIAAAAGIATLAARAVGPASGLAALVVMAVVYCAGVVALRVVSAAEWRLMRATVAVLLGARTGG